MFTSSWCFFLFRAMILDAVKKLINYFEVEKRKKILF